MNTQHQECTLHWVNVCRWGFINGHKCVTLVPMGAEDERGYFCTFLSNLLWTWYCSKKKKSLQFQVFLRGGGDTPDRSHFWPVTEEMPIVESQKQLESIYTKPEAILHIPEARAPAVTLSTSSLHNNKLRPWEAPGCVVLFCDSPSIVWEVFFFGGWRSGKQHLLLRLDCFL
jgi:hypothetical protein